ncbi:calcium-binding protein [Tropicimonas sediminicola]|uniref:Hemolysin-type calcium-binding repeat-containing protein n=1 Tax=Tropicimonas sediminicola TaxID=1031541 RepID=A0A239D9W4_9RHOB|nr:calcium-binding protein [Tropicimonas sediminicola]SNS29090.1 Hemolysin-type calcium-binding repeat-containing protein [Tropicimonas sediminicola]
MTTYTLTGFSATYDGDNATSFTPNVEFQIVGPDNSYISYSVKETSKDDLPKVSISDNLYSVTANGQNIAGLVGDDYIGTISWNGKKTTILNISIEGDNDTNTDYFIVLGGADLPDFSTLKQFDSFGDSIDGFSKATGDFAPNQRILLSEFADVDISEVDELYGTSRKDTLKGGAGEDEIYSSKGNDTFNGGADYDQLHYTFDPAAISVNLAKQTATDGWGNTDKVLNFEMVRGSMFDDTMIGDGNDNAFRGLEGDDLIKGGGGMDVARYEKDANYGGTAGVSVNLAKGTATDGFGDTDTLVSIENAYGSESGDTLIGNNGDNTFRGNGGNDTIRGAGGKDHVLGGDGKDRLLGNGGNDTLEGENGADTILGAGGRDTIVGGQGNDKLTGGNASDKFVFADGFDKDVVRDFDANDDAEVIDLSDVSSIKGFRDLKQNHMSRDSGDVVIDAGNGDVLTLLDVKFADLDAADFLF